MAQAAAAATAPAVNVIPIGDGFSTTFTVSDIRNGALESIVASVPSTAIPQEFYWVGVSDLPANRAVKFAEVIVRAHYAYIRRINSSIPEAKARETAIIVGGTRAGITAYWSVTTADLSPSELGGRIATYRAAAGTDPEGVTVTTTSGSTTTTAQQGDWTNWVALTSTERARVAYHILLGIAIIPGQGYSLVNTGHHFLSTAGKKARAGWDAIKKQFLQMVDAPTREWITGLGADWEDLAFHKAGHPVLMSLKISMASDPSMRDKIKRAGFGAAAVRLPAISPEFMKARVAQSMIMKASSILTAAGATIDTVALDNIVGRVVNETDAAARALLVEQSKGVVDRAGADLGIVAGIVQKVSEDLPTAQQTLTNSFTFRKIVAEYPAEVARGMMLARAVLSRQREAIERGTSSGVSISFGAVV